VKVENGVILRRCNWLDDGVLPLSIIIMRSCWLVPWFGFLQRWLVAPEPHVIASWFVVLGLQALGFVVARGALRFPLVRARVLVGVCGLAVVFGGLWWQFHRTAYSPWDIRWTELWATEMVTWTDWDKVGIPAPFFAFLVFSILWLRGVLDGGRLSLARTEVWRTFAAGFIALAVLLVLARLDPQGDIYGYGGLWLFFGVGMAALAITGLNESGTLDGPEPDTLAAAQNQPHFNRYWATSVGTVIFGVLAIGFALGALIAPDLVARALDSGWVLLRQVILYLWLITSVLLYPLAYVLARLFKPLSDRLTAFQVEMRLEMADRFDPKALTAQEPGRIIVELPDVLRWVALAVLIIAVALVFGLLLRRLAALGKASDVDEVRESLFSRDLIQGQMSEAWQSLVGRFSRRRAEKAQPFLSLAGEMEARRMIREVYQSLLAVAHEQGQSRPPSQTPNEYGPTLAELWDVDSHALATITESYVQARYASVPPSVEQAHLVVRAWRRILAAVDSRTEKPAELE
jgi:hypothetical protein